MTGYLTEAGSVEVLNARMGAGNNRRPAGATENMVLGPFYVAGAAVRQMGDNISLDGKGESWLYVGCVLDVEGHPVESALADVWSDNSDGFYSVQQPEIQPKWNNRGIFITAPDGAYSFRGINRYLTRFPMTGLWPDA